MFYSLWWFLSGCG